MQFKNLFGNDLTINSAGIIEMSDGDELTQEAIIRRLLTNPPDYNWHPTYGAAILRDIGKILNTDNFDNIKNTCISQILLESTVAKSPQPQIKFTPIPNDILQCDIVYYDAITKQAKSISFQVSR